MHQQTSSDADPFPSPDKSTASRDKEADHSTRPHLHNDFEGLVPVIFAKGKDRGGHKQKEVLRLVLHDNPEEPPRLAA